MKITPLAADSLGARSMATLVETPDVTILLDPSVRLGPYRYDLLPHPTERSRQKELWQVIRGAAKKADVLTVSHYHFDHHNPAAPSIFRGKLAFLKDGKFHINPSQRERSSAFVRIIRTTDVRTLILDHHILRDREWRSRMGSVFEAGKEHEVAVLTAAEFAGKPVDQLEANRDKLYGIEPSPKTISGAGPSEG